MTLMFDAAQPPMSGHTGRPILAEFTPGTLSRALRTVIGQAERIMLLTPSDIRTHRAVVAFDPAMTTPELLTKATTDAGFPSSIKQLQ